MGNYSSNTDMLRAEIAAAAARLIAEDGADYATAKKKAVKQVIGNTKVRGEIMPDNAQIEEEVRIYNEIFFGDTQPARLLSLRTLAVQLMDELAQFSPHLVGAVLNGTAGAHSDIHLQLFADSVKDVEIFLINKNIDFEISETPHFNGHEAPVETLSFMRSGEGVHLTLYDADDLRGAPKSASDGRPLRANATVVRALIEESKST